jgi:argininosuccinate synthase
MPDANILAPIRDNNLSREKEIDYLQSKNIEIGYTKAKPYSIDQNIWGRSICAGILEDISVEPPKEIYEWTRDINDCPESGEEISIDFEGGTPIKLNMKSLRFAELVKNLNEVGGAHGVGRIDHIEDRIIGIKTREIYEAPAALILIKAHQTLEALTLSKQSLDFKKVVENEYAKTIYQGHWFTHHHMNLVAYLIHNQRNVTGTIKLKLHKGNCIIISRKSEMSLYQKSLATYSSQSTFDQKAAREFVKFLGMENNIQARIQLFNYSKEIKQLENPD